MHVWILLRRGILPELGVRINHSTPTDAVQCPFVLLKTFPLIDLFF